MEIARASKARRPFSVNGQRYNGPILLNSMKPVLDGELKHAESGNQTGAAKR